MQRSAKKTTKRPPRRSRATRGKVDADYFKRLIATNNLSVRKLAKMIDYDYSVLQKVLSGQRAFHQHDVAVLAEAFNVPPDEVWRHAGMSIDREALALDRQVRIIGTVDSQGRVVDGVDGLHDRLVPCPGEVGGNAVAVQAVTPTQPHIDGWAFYFTPSERIEPEASGRLAVVTDIEGRRWLRVLARPLGSGRWLLRQYAVESDDMQAEVKSAAPVQWVRCQPPSA